LGGGYALFDGSSAVSPASLAAWRGAAGWAVGAGSRRSYNPGVPGTAASSLTSTRFPAFGFATPVGSFLVVGITASDYLNRNWDVEQADTVTPRDSAVAVTDRTRSLGGVTDIRLAAAYRVSEAVAVGVGFHLLTGSAQTTVQRLFPTDPAYRAFGQASQTDYRGTGVSVGVFMTPAPRLILGASARFNGRLRAASPSDTAHVQLPTEVAGGVYYAPVEGVTFASTVGWSRWSEASADLQAAGQGSARDIWCVGVGAEAAVLRLGGEAIPLRAGFRWRQLPFLIATSPLSEYALSAGLGFTAAGGRANVDLAVEGGKRTAGALSERFTTVLLGVSILP
jgi:long-subunit fatty acid transport protein